MTMDKVLTTKEASEVLRVHLNTLHRLLISGKLRGFKVGGTRRSRWRITEANLRKFLSQENKDITRMG
jgi:excisionase family DNA binding protein